MNQDQQRAAIWQHIVSVHDSPAPDMDPQLWEQERLLIQGIRSSAEDVSRQRIKEAIASAKMEVQKKRRQNWMLTGAASILLIILAVNFFLNPSDFHEAALVYATPAPASTLIAADYTKSLDKRDYEQGIQYYEQQNYTSAISSLTNVEAGHPQHRHASFLLANAYISQEQYKKAIPLLQSLYKTPSNAKEKNTIAWHLALAYALNNDKACIPLLEELANTPSDYQIKAQNLLLKST